MGDILIDANVIVGYFRETELGLDWSVQNLTGSTIDLFRKIDIQKDVIYLDQEEDGSSQIEDEWRRTLPKTGIEWFNYWYFTLLHTGRVKFILHDVQGARQLLIRLYRYGFPMEGGDKWYIRTAVAVVKSKNDNNPSQNKPVIVTLISEDIDFFMPDRKKTATSEERKILLLSADGGVPSLLMEHCIGLSCITNY